MTRLGIHTLGLVSLKAKLSLIKDGFGTGKWCSLRVYVGDDATNTGVKDADLAKDP